MNRLYYGDCFNVIQDYFRQSSVDLIYLDPPFNSQRQYNSIYKDETGRPLPDQIDAFCDTWELDEERERAIRTMPVLMRENGIDDAVAEFWRLWMRALRDTQPRLLAYLSYMAQRLLVMHRILKPTGSLYLHCDPTASHYIKALLDAIFGHSQFRSEIVWKRSGGKSDANRWGITTDRILFYTKSDHYLWNRQYQDHDPQYVAKAYRYDDDDGRGSYRRLPLHASGTRNGESGEGWRGYDPTLHNRHWAMPTRGIMHHYIIEHDLIPGWPSQHSTVQDKLDALDQHGLVVHSETYLPEIKTYLAATRGTAATDLIIDVPMASGKERMGYATQKPLALLERLIEASSNPGDTVLDPFCGCASTIEAAHKLGREWIGIDIAIHAIKRVASVRLTERCGLVEGQDFTVEGVPQTLEGAQDLWERDKYQFQKWAVEQVDGFVTAKQTADGGIDGRLYFDVPSEHDLQSMVLEVKGGASVGIGALRQLAGVLDTDTALMAGLIVMRPLGTIQARNFNKFIGEVGTLEILGIDYPRLQILTIDEILDGRRFKTPTVAGLHVPQPRMPGVPV